MAKIRNNSMIPQGGWTYRDRDTGHWFKCTAKSDLITEVTRHRQYKKLPLDRIAHDIDEQICLKLPVQDCTACDPGEVHQPVQDRTKGITTEMAFAANKAVISFVKGAVLSLLTGASPFVEPSVAAARAAVCRTCPFNQPLTGCSCQAAYRAIEAMVPAKRHHAGAHICSACGCSLQAKVNLPDSVISESLTPDTVFPHWCWQRPLQRIRK